MYGGAIKCPECGYDFYCETIFSSIDCPSCGTIINLEPLPEPKIMSTMQPTEEGAK